MKITILFSLFSLLVQCTENQAVSQENQPVGTEPGASADSIPFPIYPTFAEFEPLLHLENDTTYVLNFWATWCKPCIAELPYFQQLHEATKNQPVKILLVSMDFPKQVKTKLVPFVQEQKIQAPVAALIDMDYNAWIDKVSPDWDGAIPFTLIYKEKERKIKTGELENYAELEGLLKDVMH